MKLAVMYKEDCITAYIGAENEEYTVFLYGQTILNRYHMYT